jgi:hypothetical protein
MIGLAALLQFIDWYHARGLSNQQGGLSCVDAEPSLSPPRPIRLISPIDPRQFWLPAARVRRHWRGPIQRRSATSARAKSNGRTTPLGLWCSSFAHRPLARGSRNEPRNARRDAPAYRGAGPLQSPPAPTLGQTLPRGCRPRLAWRDQLPMPKGWPLNGRAFQSREANGQTLGSSMDRSFYFARNRSFLSRRWKLLLGLAIPKPACTKESTGRIDDGRKAPRTGPGSRGNGLEAGLDSGCFCRRCLLGLRTPFPCFSNPKGTTVTGIRRVKTSCRLPPRFAPTAGSRPKGRVGRRVPSATEVQRKPPRVAEQWLAGPA